MLDEDFKTSIQFAQTREAIISSALARFYEADLRFVSQKNCKDYDVCLYSSASGWASRLELQDDYYISSMDQNLLIELYTIDKDNLKHESKLFYSKADKLVYIINKLKKILLIDFKVLKDFVIKLDHLGQLQTYEPNDHQAWIAKHDSRPTVSALIPIEEILLQDPKSRVISFTDLNINPITYEQLRFHRQNDN